MSWDNHPPTLTKRHLLSGGAGLLAAAATGGLGAASAAPSGEPKTLKAAARQGGLLYGSCVDREFDQQGEDYVRLFEQQCDLLAPNFNWSMIEGYRGRLNLQRPQPGINLVAGRGLRFSGAHMLWYRHTPNWAKRLKGTTLAATLDDHIRLMSDRFGAATWSWNVLNEAVEPKDGRSDGLRVDPMLTELGTSYFVDAFHLAKSLNPNALLVYNDYGIEGTDAMSLARRKAMLDLTDDLLKANAPVEAIGLQSHLSAGLSLNQTSYASFLDELRHRGLKIILSELDVAIGTWGAVFPETMANRAAGAVGQILDVALTNPNVVAVITWGLGDVEGNAKALASGARVPQKRRALPYDENLVATPMHETLVSRFEKACTQAPTRCR